MSNPIQTGDGAGFATKVISGVFSGLGFGKKDKKRSNAFGEGTTHGDMYRAAAAVQRVANKHEKEMHSLAHAEARKTMQELGYNATSSMNFKSPTGGEFTAGGNKPKEKAAPKGQSSSNEATSTTLFSSGPDTRSKKATPKAKAAPKKAMTTKQAAISAPPVKKATTKTVPKTTTAKTPPPTSVKSRKVK